MGEREERRRRALGDGLRDALPAHCVRTGVRAPIDPPRVIALPMWECGNCHVRVVRGEACGGCGKRLLEG